MSRWFERLLEPDRTYKKLAPINKKEIDEFNEEMLTVLSLMGAFLMILPLLSVPFSDSKSKAIPLYIIAALLSLLLFLIYRLPVMKKYIIQGLYFFFSCVFLFAIFLSVIHSPHMRATILIGIFSMVSLSFIDRPARMNMFIGFWFVVHTLLAFALKPQFALDDTINTLSFAILGCIIGNMMMQVRLENYEVQRQLRIQKDTDVLTGIYNRRKLFETFGALETTNVQRPSGIMMIDIDHFKSFNDTFGHVIGDKYLNQIGGMLLQFTQNFHIEFYRYGGEEFVGIAYGYDVRELISIAESLRIAAQNLEVEGRSTTISIGVGVVYCDGKEVDNFESVIDRADQANYKAKRSGRNKVVLDEKVTPLD